MFEKPALSRRITKWLLLLAEFDIIYVTSKEIKGQAIADHLPDNPVEDYEAITFSFQDESILVIDSEENEHPV